MHKLHKSGYDQKNDGHIKYEQLDEAVSEPVS